jgi:hypothetical protein
MADKNLREAGLANAVHEAEYDVAKAYDQPAGPNRNARILKALETLDAAEQSYDDCISGRAYTLPRKR